MTIEINLLPEQLRKKKEPYFNLNLEIKRFKLWIIGGIAGVLILVILFLAGGSFVRKSQITGLSAKELKISSKLLQVGSINKEISVLKVKMGVLDELTKRRFVWSQKLNQLSDLILPGTWLTHFYTDAENKLTIEGSVVSKNEEEMASVGKFIKNMKDDDQFFKDFKDIKLESVQRRATKDEADIVDFKITLYLL